MAITLERERRKEKDSHSLNSTVTGFLISLVLLRDGPELTSSSTTTKSLRSIRREVSSPSTSESSEKSQNKSPPSMTLSPDSATTGTGDVGEVESEVEEDGSVSDSKSSDEDDLTSGEKRERSKGGIKVSGQNRAGANILLEMFSRR